MHSLEQQPQRHSIELPSLNTEANVNIAEAIARCHRLGATPAECIERETAVWRLVRELEPGTPVIFQKSRLNIVGGTLVSPPVAAMVGEKQLPALGFTLNSGGQERTEAMPLLYLPPYSGLKEHPKMLAAGQEEIYRYFQFLSNQAQDSEKTPITEWYALAALAHTDIRLIDLYDEPAVLAKQDDLLKVLCDPSMAPFRPAVAQALLGTAHIKHGDIWEVASYELRKVWPNGQQKVGAAIFGTLPRPEVLVPDGGLLDESFLNAIDSCVAKELARIQHDPAISGKVAATMRSWAQQGNPGEPIVRFSTDYRNNNHLSIFNQGVLFRPIYGAYSRASAGWRARADIRRLDGNDLPIYDTIEYDPFVMVEDHAKPDSSPYTVGWQALKERLRAIGLYALKEENPRPDQLRADVNIIFGISRLHGASMVELLELTPQMRDQLAAGLLSVVLDPNCDSTYRAFMALHHIVRPVTDEENESFFNTIDDKLAARLPLSGGAVANAHTVEQLSSLRMWPPEKLPKGVQGVAIREKEFLPFVYMAQLYERRVEQERGTTQALLLTPPSIAEPGELPPPRDLHVATQEHVSAALIRDDISYLRALQANGYPSPYAIERTHKRMVLATDQICAHITAQNDHAARAEAFFALEYLHDPTTPQEEQLFYSLIARRFAASLPIDATAPMRGVLGVAQTLSEIAPQLLPEPHRTLGQPARTAAMMAVMYETRAELILHHALNAYQPTTPDQESAAAG